MKLWSFLFFGRRNRRTTRSQVSRRGRCARPRVEALEDRFLPSGNTISGFVYNDTNNNGIFDAGESPIANSAIELLNSSGVVVGTTVTDANGYYVFSTDGTIDTSPTTLTKSAAVASTPTDWTQNLLIPQFDPSLGTLLSIDITNAGTFSSGIKVESLDSASSTITATDSGSLTLTGPGITGLVTTGSASKSFNATAYDGVLDFGGTSGHDFGTQTASGTNSITLTGSSMAAFTGTGSVTLNNVAHATSTASGAGNLITQINTNASAQVSVVYHYIPSNLLKPGNYELVQTSQPPGLLEGKESSNGVGIPNSVGSDSIAVTLGNTDSQNNNFAEINPASVCGYVYVDANNDGIMQPDEAGIPSATLTLTGTNDLGAAVSQTQVTGADGSYCFRNLRPGAYSIVETQPAGYLQGKNSIGSVGGTMGVDTFNGVNLAPATAGMNYNFGEVQAARLSGFVYLDFNNDGIFQSNENGIAGVTVTLTGTDDIGDTISTVQVTARNGSYQFIGLRPGTYTITETQPRAYLDGKDTVGSLGGIVNNDQFSAIVVPSAATGVSYNFGERLPNNPTTPYIDTTPSTFGHPNVQLLSKLQLLSSSWAHVGGSSVNVQATYVDSLYRTLLGHPANRASLLNWVKQLAQGTTRAQVVAAIWNSDEHLTREVDHIFVSFLHRHADSASLTLYVGYLKSGSSTTDIARMVILSDEYQNNHPDDVSYVVGLYSDILGQQVSDADVQAWLDYLQAGGSRASVAMNLLQSSTTYRSMLQADYTRLLHHSLTSAGQTHYLTAMTSGAMSPEAVEQAILASNEYYQLAAKASRGK
jgi:uncharacterized protein (DUF2141 family)